MSRWIGLVTLLAGLAGLLTGCRESGDGWITVSDERAIAHPAHKLAVDRIVIDHPLLAMAATPNGKVLCAAGWEGTLTCSTNNGKHWLPRDSKTRKTLRALQVLADDNTLCAVGDEGTITCSTDAGVNWQTYDSGTRKTLRTLQAFADGKTMCAAGDEGTITCSTHASDNWQLRDSGTENDLYTLKALADDKTLCAAGEGGTLICSTDADAKNWKSHDSGTRKTLRTLQAFTHGKTMCAAGDEGTITCSTHAGDNWQTRASRTGKDLNALQAFADGKTLCAAGDEGTITCSTDTGENWQLRDSGTENDLYTLEVTNDGQTLCAAGTTLICSTDTTGYNWHSQDSDASNALIALQALPDGTMCAAGLGGTLICSTKADKKWQLRANGTGTNLTALLVLTDSKTTTLCAAGWSGVLTCSTDAGENWHPRDSKTDNNLNAIHAFNDNKNNKTLCAAGDKGTITCSTDAGKNWQLRDSGTENNLYTLKALANGKTLCAAGEGGTLICSTDADAKNWKSHDSGTRTTLRTLQAFADGALCAAGWGGTLTCSTNAEEKWQPRDSNTDKPLFALALADSAHDKTSCATGAYGALICSTHNGENWQSRNSMTDNALDALLALADGNILCAAGTNGALTCSNNAGANWQLRDSKTRKNLNALQALDGKTLCAAGANGTLTCSIDAGTSWLPLTSGTENDLVALHALADGKTLWAVGTRGVRVRITTTEPLPLLKRIRPVTTPAGLDLFMDFTQKLDNCWIDLWGADKELMKENDYRPKYKIDFDPIAGQPLQYRLDLLLNRFSIDSGDDVYLKLDLTCDDYPQHFEIPGSFKYRGWWQSLKENQTALLILASGVVLLVLASLVFLLYLLLPGQLLAMIEAGRRSTLGQALGKLPPPYNAVNALVQVMTLFLPWIAGQRRCLDAWCKTHHTAVLDQFERTATRAQAIPRAAYVALPVRFDDSGEEAAPDAGRFRDFYRQRAIVEIRAPGGTGKTSLAIQISRWMAELPAPERLLPVMLERDRLPLADSVRDELTAALDGEDHAPSLALVTALLKRRRLLVIVDRVSERGDDLRNELEDISRHIGITALLVTTRTRIDWHAGPVHIHCLRLRPLTTLVTISQLIEGLLGAQNECPEVLKDTRAQTDLAHRLVNALKGIDGKLHVTPLLVRLFLEQAIALVRKGEPLEQLPLSIPALYTAYLARIVDNHPGRNTSAEDVESSTGRDSERALLLALLYAVAWFELGDDFIPSAVSRNTILDRLTREPVALLADWVKKPAELLPILRRLEASGILHGEASGSDRLLRYTLDPVAEFAAAHEHAMRCGTSREAWEALANRIEALPRRPEGFIEALRLICAANGSKGRWRHEGLFDVPAPVEDAGPAAH